LLSYLRDESSRLLTWELGKTNAQPREERLAGFCTALSPDLRLVFTRRTINRTDTDGLAVRGTEHFRPLVTPRRANAPFVIQSDAVFLQEGRLSALAVTHNREPKNPRSDYELAAILVYECATGNLVAQIPVSGPGRWLPPMQFDRSGRTLVFGADDGLHRWD